MPNDEYPELISFLGERFDRIDQRFEQIDERFEQIDRRFEQVDRRFERLEVEVRHNGALIEDNAHRTQLVAEKVGFNGTRLEELIGTADGIDGRVGRLEAATAGLADHLEGC